MTANLESNDVVGNVLVAVVDRDGWWLATVDEEAALTIIAVASEDPDSWSEMENYWPRYWTPSVPEFAATLMMEQHAEAVAMSCIDEAVVWLVVDTGNKQIFTSEHFQEVGRDQAYAMLIEDDERQRWPLSIHLPPWWEFHEQREVDVIKQDREEPVRRPQPNRRVLFGPPLIEDLAGRMLDIASSDRWRKEAPNDEVDCYPMTIEVHRDWLMTPREDLGGLYPRQMLHGAIDWIDDLLRGQQLCIEDRGCVVATPAIDQDLDRSPMGREEVCTYFDYCRALVAAGWRWCLSPKRASRLRKQLSEEQRAALETSLREELETTKEKWLNEPFEGGSPPRFILECCRRRVPRGMGLKIQGMDEFEPENHPYACDCPICAMMAEGAFGVTFVGIDGHHLELDDEFAFSLCDDHDEWKWQQESLRNWANEFEASQPKEEASKDNRDGIDNELAPTWPMQNSEVPYPGDADGHMAFAFKLADVVGCLQMNHAPEIEVKQLNQLFKEFRHAETEERVHQAGKLKDFLQRVGERYPELVAKSADLQSLTDELLRRPILGDV